MTRTSRLCFRPQGAARRRLRKGGRPARQPGLRLRGSARWLLLLAAFRTAAGTPARTETFGRGEVTLEVQASAREVSPDSDLELTLALTHPETLDVLLPEDFADRLEGFRLERLYEGESISAGGLRRRTLHLLARPLPAAERYRIAPFPVRILDPASPAREQWFPTRAIVFEAASLLRPEEPAPDGVQTALEPLWIRPAARTILGGFAATAAAAAALVLLVRLARFVRRRVRLARMAPRERALFELRELLACNLPEQGRAKDFYVALTGIVRRYIERRHAIRAYEQTTEEFLRDAVAHPAFTAGTLARLREFLDAADLVKFAGVTASEETIARSVAGARTYLENEPPAPRRGAAEVKA